MHKNNNINKEMRTKAYREREATQEVGVILAHTLSFFLFFKEPGCISRKAVSVESEGRETQQAPNGEWYIERLSVAVGPRPLS